jgi:hypothetical protein
MQSTNIRRMKAAIWNQAFTGRAQMWCPMGSTVWLPKGGRKGQLLAMVRGWGCWYPRSECQN